MSPYHCPHRSTFTLFLILFGIFSTFFLIFLFHKSDKVSVCDKVYKIFNGEDKSRYFSMFYEKFSYYTDDNNFQTKRGKISLDLPRGQGRLDNGRTIRIYDFLRVGEEWEQISTHYYSVCLATQTSIERLYHLPRILESWNGPLSVAVLVVNEKEWLVLNLYSLYLERCNPYFRDFVAIHLAVPVSAKSFHFDEEKLRKMNVGYLLIEAMKRDCGDNFRYLTVLLENFEIPTLTFSPDEVARKIVYPQNHLRNIARKGCPTFWTYSTDIDIVPSRKMAQHLNEFFTNLSINDQLCLNCAYVVPTFELDEIKRFPSNKSELVRHFNYGTAKIYHGMDLPLTQDATDYSKWTSQREEGPVMISHNIKNDPESIQEYEPFYVSSDLIDYDERFLGYGPTRNSQFLEALVRGWNFTVLTPVFSIHWGFNYPSNNTDATDNMTMAEFIRYNQTESNRKLHEQIIKEILVKQRENLFLQQ